MTKVFDYGDWLAKLTTGDKVKITTSNSCKCEKLEINGFVQYGNKQALVVVEGCSARHFCIKTGRELSASSSSYRDAQIMPWTNDDDKQLQLRKEKEALKQEQQNLIDRLRQAFHRYNADREGVVSTHVAVNLSQADFKKLVEFVESLHC